MGTSTRSAPARSVRGSPSPTREPPLGRTLFLLNLKVYPAVLGKGARALGEMLQRVAAERAIPAAIAPPMPDLSTLAGALSIPVLAQHVDPFDAGARTGWVPAEAVRAVGARGSLVNHSEHPLEPGLVRVAVDRLRAEGLVAVVCARTTGEAVDLARTRPEYLAIEPPELIGGPVSVSSARPELIRETVDAVRKVSPTTLVLCGAGIRDRRDVAKSIELGSAGVLVASAVTTAPDPERALRELLDGF